MNKDWVLESRQILAAEIRPPLRERVLVLLLALMIALFVVSQVALHLAATRQVCERPVYVIETSNE